MSVVKTDNHLQSMKVDSQQAPRINHTTSRISANNRPIFARETSIDQAIQ